MAQVALTEELISEVTVYLAKGATRAEAAMICGIHPSTLYKWVAQGRKAKSGLKADLALAVDKADAAAQVKLSGIIFRAAQRGDTKAAIWRKTQGAALDEYHEIQRLTAEQIRVKIEGDRIENRRKEAETRYRELINTGIEAQQKQGDEPTDFTKNSIRMQQSEATIQQIEEYYDLPSPQEDQDQFDALQRQHEAEERKRQEQEASGIAASEDLTNEEIDEHERMEIEEGH